MQGKAYEVLPPGSGVLPNLTPALSEKRQAARESWHLYEKQFNMPNENYSKSNYTMRKRTLSTDSLMRQRLWHCFSEYQKLCSVSASAAAQVGTQKCWVPIPLPSSLYPHLSMEWVMEWPQSITTRVILSLSWFRSFQVSNVPSILN